MDQPVFFYPHRYLRERHLDVMRAWRGPVVNPDLGAGRAPDNVDRDRATGASPSGPSLRHRLWLPNIKPRPRNLPSDAAVYAFGAAVLPGPFITDLDNPYALVGYKVPALRLYRPLFRALLSSTSCIELRCLSEACRAGLAAELGHLVAARARVVYPAMAPLVESPPHQTGECRFLFVGSQFDIKGGPSLIRAFARLRQSCPGARLDIVGHLSADHLALAGQVAGIEIHQADMARSELFERFFRRADVLIHPTFADSFGMVVLEAMAHGLAVVATDVYALPELVQDGVNGRLVEAPLSIWDGHRPTPFFSDLAALRHAAAGLRDVRFEDSLLQSMLSLALDRAFCQRAKQASLERVRCLHRIGRFE